MDTPPKGRRIAAALLVATVAATFPVLRHIHDPTHPADFGLAWFGAQALLHRADPYVLIGPGRVYDWRWSLIYPATVMVAAMPLAWLPQLAATVTFVWISSCLLAYVVTARGWFRLLMFFTPSFSVAAGAAQWSPLLTASLFLPSIGLLLAAKPNIGLVFAIAGSWRLRRFAVLGGVLLTGISLFLLPSWPFEWIRSLGTADYVNAPIARLGGFLILLALLRWRRPETWLLLALACVPQTTYWYEVLPLFLIPASFAEMMLLAGTCSIGSLFEHLFLHSQNDAVYTHEVGILLVVFVYLPATIMILRRPNLKATAPWQTVTTGASLPRSGGALR